MPSTGLDASYVQGNETVKENETLTLICEASGNPTPNIYWFKDDDLLLSTNTTYQKTSHRNDDGSYTCNATNSFGSRTSEAFDVDVFCMYCFTCGVSEVKHCDQNTKTPSTGGCDFQSIRS